VFIATVSTSISLFCGLLAGYALARLQFIDHCVSNAIE
jgi:ABC-type glycerol-3-phosphate transport system permease component